ncbi:MAG: dihydrolipoamide acetyltransferase family protein [Chloroflexota bacterium]|nr:dihydrolipoamide acetyltransferase family protein [Chloroflexota bacterium]
MTHIIELPHVGESVVEGTIGKWLKVPGDHVDRYDPLVEIITDKVTMEFPSPVSGTLLSILAQEGETIPMGAPIAEFETSDDAPTVNDSEPEPPSAASVTAPISTIGYLVKNVAPVGPTGGGPDGEPIISDAQPVAASSTNVPTQESKANSGTAPRLSPAVRRLAEEHNIDLAIISGSGAGGRITRDDVLSHLSASEQPPTSQLSTADDTYITVTPIRRMIAEAMVRSVTTIPHAWSTIEVDVTNLVTVRNTHRQAVLDREGVDLTYLPFIIKMVVEALRDNPTLNATWGGDKIILKNRINMGIAVAGPDGLIVPVIKNADQKSIIGLANAVGDLTSKVRNKKLSINDVQEGTFTLNNTGVLGSTTSQPIINHPQAAILTTEAIQKRPVVIQDAIAIRSVMNMCMSFDHRINDGAESSTFLQSIKRRIEAITENTPIY